MPVTKGNCTPVSPIPATSSAEDLILAPISGYVYILRAGPFYKIGKTIDPGRRMKQLAVQLPWKPEIVHLIASDDHHALERELHLGLDHCRANGEWFEINDRQLAYIRREYGGYSAAVPLP